jgi:hypothetical protein
MLSVWTVATVAYGLTWLAAVLIVNTRRSSAASNAVTLVGLWVVGVVLFPFAIERAAVAGYPLPPYSALVDVARNAPDQVARMDERELAANSGATHTDEMPSGTLFDMGRMYLVGAARAEAVQRIVDRARRDVDDRLASQEWFITISSVLTPATALQQVALECAGTGRGRYLDFVLQDEAFQHSLNRFFNPRKFALPTSVFRSTDYERIPRFRYRKEPALAVLRRRGRPCGIQIAYGIVAVAISLAALK